MPTYTIIAGDTFEIISRKQYGTEDDASLISSANSGVMEPLTPGTNIVIPDKPDAPQNIQQNAAANEPNETAVLIEGTRFRFWEAITITRSIDSMDTVEFSAPWDETNQKLRDIFRPVSFKSLVVTVGGVPLFTGTMMGVNPMLDTAEKVLSVNSYSLPGVLNDCNAPASTLDKLEFNNQGLREIAIALVSPFGISVRFIVDQGAIFEQVSATTGQKVLAFLTQLAKQRNLIVSNTPLGQLLFQQSTTIGSPVAILRQGSAPLLTVTPIFNPQEYYSHITGIEPVFIFGGGSQFTVKNDRLKGVIRPFNFDIPDTQDADIKAAVEAKIGRMFGNVVFYSITLSTWRDSKGNLWEPNTTIKINAPTAMIYADYEFIIRSVRFEQDSDSQTATLNLVMPGTFSGEIPETLPWDD